MIALSLLLFSIASAAFASPFCDSPSPPFFDVVKYGGVGDGVTLNTRAFAAAMSAAAAAVSANGGAPQRVLAKTGVYLSGQIVMKSGVTLCVAPDARLLASANKSDYPTDEAQWAFLFSSQQSAIGVGGGGILDGNFLAYSLGWNEANDQFVAGGWPGCVGECRPRLVIFADTVGIVVESVTFTSSPDWTFQLLNCSNVLVANWTQRGSEMWPNNDGIDIDSSSHVLVRDSSIDTGDDGVCIKGSRAGGEVYNVTVRNTVVRSRSSAIKFGSNCGIPMHALLFENITVHDSNRGLALQARDGPCVGGVCIFDVIFRQIFINGTRFWPFKWWGDGSAIHIDTMLRTPTSAATGVSNVTFEDIVAFSQGGAVLSGRLPGGHVEGVTLRRVNITITRWPAWNYSQEQGIFPNIEYDPSTVPHLSPGSPINTRFDLTGFMPGLYVENVQGLELEDLNIAFRGERQPYWGTACLNTSQANYPVSIKGGSCDLGLASPIV
jgi:polygalacturonase